MEQEKKKSKVGLIIVIIVAILLIGGGVYYYTQHNKSEKPKEDSNTIVNKYTAYIKINPSIKLDYSQTCHKQEDDSFKCDEPIVDDYKLINEDAEEIFEDVDLFKGGKTLDKVIETICEKAKENNIEVKDVQITSDWSEINTYMETSTKQESTTYNYTVNVTTKEVIEETIKTEEKNEEENKTTTTTTTTTSTSKTTTTSKKTTTTTTTTSTVIDLSKGVLYSHNMFTYVCKEPGCFSDSLISSIKNNKGTYVRSANNDEITIAYITRLSDPYNDKKLKGTAPISKIEAAGGEQQGGAGGSDEPLTMEDCKNFHLSCK